MPPVLSKGGAASKLSATEPASVLAPSPETSCQQTESQVSHSHETNTQEGRTHLKDMEQVGSRPTSELTVFTIHCSQCLGQIAHLNVTA